MKLYTFSLIKFVLQVSNEVKHLSKPFRHEIFGKDELVQPEDDSWAWNNWFNRFNFIASGHERSWAMPMIRLLLLGWFFQPIYQHTQKAGSHIVHTFTIIKFRQTNFLSGVNTVKTNYIKGYFLGVLLMWANAKAIVEDTFHFEIVTRICNFSNYYFLTLYVQSWTRVVLQVC